MKRAGSIVERSSLSTVEPRPPGIFVPFDAWLWDPAFVQVLLSCFCRQADTGRILEVLRSRSCNPVESRHRVAIEISKFDSHFRRSSPTARAAAFSRLTNSGSAFSFQ